ncbi:6439_t:CDS:2, partial [Ambispora leptoticha]
MFITTSGLLGYHILKGAVQHIKGDNGVNIFLFGACDPINYQDDVDLCSASILTWSLIAGAKKRIDLLTIPNRLMGFRKWTHSHIQRLLLSVYALITTCLIANNLSKKTVDNNDYLANMKDQGQDSHIYNSYFLPYYVAMYLYVKSIIATAFEIKSHLGSDNPEKIAVDY